MNPTGVSMVPTGRLRVSESLEADLQACSRVLAQCDTHGAKRFGTPSSLGLGKGKSAPGQTGNVELAL